MQSIVPMSNMQTTETPKKLRVLVAAAPPRLKILDIVNRCLSEQAGIELRHLADVTTARDISDWADMLVLAPIDANHLARMLHGFVDNLILEILRSWDVSKEILLIPAMSTSMWENPMTKKQLNKIRRKWNWIRVLPPVLWGHLGSEGKNIMIVWEGTCELVDAVRNHVDLTKIGHDLDATMDSVYTIPKSVKTSLAPLPSEIWTMVFDYVGDWELSKAMGIYTGLPTPIEWASSVPIDHFHVFLKELERTILTGTFEGIKIKLSAGPGVNYLSNLCVKLIIKFARTDLLSYIEVRHEALFSNTFGHKVLPTKASAVYGKLAILEWWRTSPSFLTKEYTHDAVDGASKAGFVQVLDWWRKSGFTMRYSEAALEQASSRGHIDVLEWWKRVSTPHEGYNIDSLERPLRLKVGKSICFAAQYGQEETVRWWYESGIPYPHEELVVKIASSYGHVNVLRLWKELKGEKMVCDHQVLVGPTKNGHRDVLEWWKNSGFRVEYKTCDIEEALEDSLGGLGEEMVRAWWTKNGLNLGVGTSEWMKVKVL